MPLNARAEDYAELTCAEALDQLAADERSRLAAIGEDHVSRGLASSSGRINEIRIARLEFAEKRVIARIEARLRAHRKFGVPMDEDETAALSAHATRGLNDAARQIASELIAQLRASGINDRSMASALNESVVRDAGIVRSRLLRRIEIMGIDEELRATAEGVRENEASSHDLFLSHAGEDKETIARPLKESLESVGYKVWFDEAELTLGDSLRSKIDEGLRTCRFGIVVLSPAFFRKPWPKAELDGLSAREAQGVKVILPIVHGLTHEELAARSPTLAGRIFVETEKGLDVVVASIARAIGPSSSSASLAPSVRRGSSEVADENGSELTIAVTGVWWSAHQGAFPMYLHVELTHAGEEPDSVKRVRLEVGTRTVNLEKVDAGKLGELKVADFKEVELKFFPAGSGREEPMKLVIETVRGKHASAVFQASLSGWRPSDMWRDFVPY